MQGEKAMETSKNGVLKIPSMPEIKFHREAILIEVVDGDTLDIEIDLGWSAKLKERVRLEFVDTPEINNREENKYGKLIKAHVQEFLPEETSLIITSTAYERTGRIRGKFGRTIATIYRASDGWCLNDYLLQNRFGWRTKEKGELAEERDLSTLTGFKRLHGFLE